MAFTSLINSHAVLMDTTADDGGDDSGPSPKRLMLASLDGCTGMYVVSILAKMKVEFSNFSMDIDDHVTDEHPNYYDQVKLIYKIKVEKADQSKVEKAVSLSQEKYCGVTVMFKAFAKLETEIICLD